MKTLVTGATGFLGGALVRRLLERGERDLRCFVRAGSRTGTLEAIAADHPGARVELFAGSLSSLESVAAALEGVGTVYHLAAALSGAAADIFLGTVVASRHLLDGIAAAARPIKVVLVSSFGVYGAAELPRGAVIDEDTPLERHPERRDVYSHAKLRQEQLFREYQTRHRFPLVVLRPGVIYGPGGAPISARVGLNLAGVFLHLGGSNPLPLTYVDNCADALVTAGSDPRAVGQTYNVVDDASVGARAFLDRYQREVGGLRVVRLPYPVLVLLSHAVLRYHRWSRGQLPAVFTPYRTAATWRPMRFDNSKLRALGWEPRVSTNEGLARSWGLRQSQNRAD